MDEAAVEQAGRYQAGRWLAGEPLDLMAQGFAPTSLDEAYAVQRVYLAELAGARGELGGLKIAYTSAVMRESRGISAPCTGGLFASEVVESPVELKAADYQGLAIECEVGVRLGVEVGPGGAPWSRESIAPHVASVMTAFEVVDQRASGGPDGVDPAIAGVVTNISAAGAVVGPAVRNWESIDLAGARGTMTINGDLVGEGLGSDVMGHPIEALVWLANTLAERGESIPAGSLVITGSIIPPKPLSAGDEAVIAVEGLGEARLSVR